MSKKFDLFIIGGGINGAGIARDAAGRGLSVCLADKGEIGGACLLYTSDAADEEDSVDLGGRRIIKKS